MTRYIDWKDKHTATLFADGAGAVIGGWRRAGAPWRQAPGAWRLPTMRRAFTRAAPRGPATAHLAGDQEKRPALQTG